MGLASFHISDLARGNEQQPYDDSRTLLLAEFLGWGDQQIRTRIDELAELTHFPAAGLARYPTQLSGGQQQRVSLMRALMLDPDVLLMDEPLGALDPMIRSELQGDLKEIFEALGKAVVRSAQFLVMRGSDA